MDCPEDSKVSIVAFLLEGRALNWWTSIISRQPQGVEMTRRDLKREYYQQYYTDHYKDQKRREFTRLTQGGISVIDYEATFIELSKFVAIFVTDEWKKSRLF